MLSTFLFVCLYVCGTWLYFAYAHTHIDDMHIFTCTHDTLTTSTYIIHIIHTTHTTCTYSHIQTRHLDGISYFIITCTDRSAQQTMFHVHAHTHTRTHAHMHMRFRAHVRTHTHMHAPASTCAHRHTRHQDDACCTCTCFREPNALQSPYC